MLQEEAAEEQDD